MLTFEAYSALIGGSSKKAMAKPCTFKELKAGDFLYLVDKSKKRGDAMTLERDLIDPNNKTSLFGATFYSYINENNLDDSYVETKTFYYTTSLYDFLDMSDYCYLDGNEISKEELEKKVLEKRP